MHIASHGTPGNLTNKNHTDKLKKLTALAALAASSITALAGQPMVDKNPAPPAPESFYNAHEFYGSVAALLAAKTGSLPSGSTFNDDTNWGADVELGYFFTRNFGMALEGEYISFGRPVWGSALNFYLRAPLHEGSRWAPYLLGGVGGLYGNGDGRFEGHVGAGIEYRFTPKFGTFLDGRHCWVDGQQDSIPQFGLFRAGIKFVF